MAEITQPSERALDHLTPSVAPKNAAILWRRPTAVQAEGRDQQDAPPSQLVSQCVTVISFVGDHPQWFLPGTPSMMVSTCADRRERLGDAHFRRDAE